GQGVERAGLAGVGAAGEGHFEAAIRRQLRGRVRRAPVAGLFEGIGHGHRIACPGALAGPGRVRRRVSLTVAARRGDNPDVSRLFTAAPIRVPGALACATLALSPLPDWPPRPPPSSPTLHRPRWSRSRTTIRCRSSRWKWT